jgi:hypothetical protein
MGWQRPNCIILHDIQVNHGGSREAHHRNIRRYCPVWGPGLAASPALAAGGTCFGQAATIVGTDGDDTLTGTEGTDVIVGLAGGDIIDGLGGSEQICAGDNAAVNNPTNSRLDVVHGGSGNDRIDGGPGLDIIDGDDGDDDLYAGGGLTAAGKESAPGWTPFTAAPVTTGSTQDKSLRAAPSSSETPVTT